MYEGLKLEFNIKECREYTRITKNMDNDISYTLRKLALTNDTKLFLSRQKFLRTNRVLQIQRKEKKQAIIAIVPKAIKDKIEQLPLILLSYDLFRKFQTSKLFSDQHFLDLEFQEGLVNSGGNTYKYQTMVHVTERGPNTHIFCWVNEKYKEIFQIPDVSYIYIYIYIGISD